jgi:hypothetical protein
MDQELKAKWVKALRSGEYEQGASVLRDGKYYCCLGVLAECAGAKWNEEGNPTLDGQLIKAYSSEHLRDGFAGLETKTQSYLAQMNDGYLQGGNGEAASFTEIADYIEANL